MLVANFIIQWIFISFIILEIRKMIFFLKLLNRTIDLQSELVSRMSKKMDIK